MQADYETDDAVQQYLLFHYGSVDDQLPYPFGPREALSFPVRCVETFAGFFPLPVRRALDLGCAVGRATFELSRHAGEVLGIDLSARFIEAARAVARDGEARFWRAEEGDLRTELRRPLPPDLRRERCRFEVGDATSERADWGLFDVILAANLLDRVASPKALLRTCARHLRPGGTLVLASPYTWLEAFTPRAAWLGGRQDAHGRRLETLSSLHTLLDGTCDHLATVDLPFLLREHARKYQWGVAQTTAWRRR